MSALAPARAWLCLCLTPAVCVAQAQTAAKPPAPAPAYAPDRILVQPKAGLAPEPLAGFHAAHRSKILRTFEGIGHLQVVSVPKGESVADLIAQYQHSGLVQFAEPDYIGHVFATPNDQYYTNGSLWGLTNIEAPAAWNVLTSATNILVAVLDTGVRYTHEDLSANMWVNPNDPLHGHGLNALTGSNDPSDDNGHGTMMAGVIGAVGNNNKGVVGVAWQVQLMACKCADLYGRLTTSAAITCIDYALTNSARIINASWGLTNSLALSNAFYSARTAGIIVVAACGNSTNDIDINPTYPASYPLDNIISVASTTTNNTLATSSNYGATSVGLGAPGEGILSTFAASDTNYYTLSGTSFSAAYVSGALALMLAEYPGETYLQIINRILGATDPLPSLAGKCRTGGRLNLRKTLTPIRLTGAPAPGNGPFQLHLSATTNLTCIIQASSDLANWPPIFTNSTSTTGTFDFSDDQSTNLAQRFYRAVASP